MSTELATTEDADLELSPEQEAQLAALEDKAAANVRSKIDADDLVLPMLKVAQALTEEVVAGDARPGNYVNSLTGEVYDEGVEVVLIDTFKGRFYSPKDEDGSWSSPDGVVPSNWPEAVAPTGIPFAEHPLAEEVWKDKANAGDIEWGSGPPIQTTHNFVGFVVGDDSGLPIRLSLKSASVPQARKLNTLITTSRTPWSNVYSLATSEESNASNQRYFVPKVTRGRPTTPAERLKAAELYEQYENQNVVLQGDEAHAEPEVAQPADDGSAIEID